MVNMDKPYFVRVTTPYLSEFANPIHFSKGDLLVVGKQDTGFPGWIWTTTPDNNQGWAPMAILSLDGQRAVAQEDYIATELSTKTGERLRVTRELAGWLWVTRDTQESGWIPAGTAIRHE